MGRRELRVRRDHLRGRIADREDPGGSREPAEPEVRHRDRRRRRDRRRDPARRDPRPRPRGRRGGPDRAPRQRRPRRRLHLHLHLRHDRPAQGLHPAAPQLPRGPRHDQRARPARRRGRPRLPLPPARARVRAADPARRRRHGHRGRLLRRRHPADHPRADAGPPDLPAVGPAHLREALHARPGPDPRARDRRGQRPRRPDARPRVPGRARPAGAAGPLERADRGRRAGPLARADRRVREGPVRREPARGRHRRRADRLRHPALLLRRGRPRHGGLRDDGDRDGRDDLHPRAPQVRLRRPGAARASRSRSPRTARS